MYPDEHHWSLKTGKWFSCHITWAMWLMDRKVGPLFREGYGMALLERETPTSPHSSPLLSTKHPCTHKNRPQHIICKRVASAVQADTNLIRSSSFECWARVLTPNCNGGPKTARIPVESHRCATAFLNHPVPHWLYGIRCHDTAGSEGRPLGQQERELSKKLPDPLRPSETLQKTGQLSAWR